MLSNLLHKIGRMVCVVLLAALFTFVILGVVNAETWRIATWRTNYTASLVYSNSTAFATAPNGVALIDTEIRMRSGAGWVGLGSGVNSNGTLMVPGSAPLRVSYPLNDPGGYSGMATGLNGGVVEVLQRGEQR